MTVVITDTFGVTQTLTTDGSGVYITTVPIGPAVIDIDESTLPAGYVQTAGADPTTVTVPAGGTASDIDGYFFPTNSPTSAPTAAPTSSPTGTPTATPTGSPTKAPTPGTATDSPTVSPSASPSSSPSESPSEAPTSTPVGKIVGIVFEDTNGNGIKDPFEPGIPGVDVVITDSSGTPQTVTTNGGGMYTAVVPVGPAVTDIVESTLPVSGATQTAGVDPTTVVVPAGGTATDEDGFQYPTGAPTSAPTSAPTRPATTGSPTKTPTSSPTSSPTGSPTASPTSGAPSCVNATVTFDVDANGNPIAPGKYVQNEWASFGLSLSATGGEGSTPRLFDTANPGSEDTCGDEDLGAPNEACTPSGPGVGEGGAPGKAGENCSPLGNVLIVQEPNAPCPDDNKDGGVIVFDFFSPAQYVYEMTFLDVDDETTVEVIHETDSGLASTVFNLQLLGNNSKEVLEINLENVRQILVTFSRSGAVASIDFCYNPNDIPTAPPAAPTPAAVTPTPSPTTSPTGTPTRGPTSSPTGKPTSTPTKSPTSSPTASPTATPTGKVKGTVFEDTNGNGVQDPSEPGLPGVDVVITDSEGNVFTLTTDATGMYMAEVPAGPTVTDIVESTLPEGSVQTVGTDPTTVDVPAGGTATDLDGFKPTGKIVGIVFEDTNGNGVQDPGEPGIPRVSVMIRDSSRTVIIRVTNSDGEYSATVPVGPTVTNIVESTVPRGYIRTVGTDPTTVLVPSGGTATDIDGFHEAN